MTGSNMFVVYANGSAGGVTISPRSGEGHHLPPANPDSPDVELLAGSGIDADAGVMTANVRCGSCASWDGGAGSMSLGGEATDWIAAWRQGDALDTADAGASFSMHEPGDHDNWQFDLSQAIISSDANPFLTSGDNDQAGGGGTGSGTGTGVSAGRAPWYIREIPTLKSAHGILMAVVFVILYPLGALLMPLLGRWALHAGWQMLAFLGMWAGFGLGVVLTERTGYDFRTTHTRLGLAVVILMAFQPALGWAHHVLFKKRGSRTPVSHAHVWYGRALMVLGVVNGGLGLALARAGTGFVIAYSVVAAAVFLIYAGGAAALGLARHRKEAKKDRAAGVGGEGGGEGERGKGA
ncbi:hypothetical protein F4778DRAFT_734414 [Xylariomycetidae sp. FL2044]|nr:hypothetical protein F4778DRAFT_734414 [Xylariomycetidae sp. FL2044]